MRVGTRLSDDTVFQAMFYLSLSIYFEHYQIFILSLFEIEQIKINWSVATRMITMMVPVVIHPGRISFSRKELNVMLAMTYSVPPTGVQF